MSLHQLNLQKDNALHHALHHTGDAAGDAAVAGGTPVAKGTTKAGVGVGGLLSSPMSMAFINRGHLVTPDSHHRDGEHEAMEDNGGHDGYGGSEDPYCISEVASTASRRSWATISEIDSQCFSHCSASSRRRPSLASSRRSSSRSLAAAFEGKEEDEDEEESDDEEEEGPSPRPPSTLTLVMRRAFNGVYGFPDGDRPPHNFVATGSLERPEAAAAAIPDVPPERDSSAQQHLAPFGTLLSSHARQQGGDSTSERAPPTRSSSFNTRSSLNTYTGSVAGGPNDDDDGGFPSKHHRNDDVDHDDAVWRQRCLQAEDHVFEAREELAAVEAQLDGLQHRHAVEVRDLHRQIVQHTAAELELRNSLRGQQSDLDGAQMKVRALEQEKETLQQQAKARSLVEDQEQHQQRKLASVGAASKELERRLEQLMSEKAEAETKLLDALQKLAGVESERDAALARQVQLESALEASVKKVRFALDQNEVLECQVNDYQKQLHESERCAEEKAKQLSILQENLHSIQSDHKELREKHFEVVKNQKAVYVLKSLEHQKQVEYTEQAQQQLEALRQEQENLHQNFTTLQQERTELQCRLEGVTAELQDAKNCLEERDGVASQLQTELLAMREAVTAAAAAHDEALQEKISLTARAEAKLRDALRQVEELQNEKQGLVKQISRLHEEQTALEQRVEDATNSLDRSNERLAEKEAERCRLEREYQKLQQLVQTLETEQQREREEQKSVVADHEKAVAAHEVLMEASLSKVRELTAERDGLISKLDEVEAERTAFDDKHRTVQQAHVVLQSTHTDLQEKLSERVQTYKEAAAQSDKLRNDLQKERDGLQGTVESLRCESAHLESIVSSSSMMLSEARSQLADEEEKTKQLTSQLADLQASTEGERERQRKEVEGMIEAHKILTIEAEATVAELVTARETFKIEMEELEGERSRAEQELLKVQSLHSTANESCQESRRQLTTALQAQELYKRSAEKQIEELKSTEAGLLQKVQSLEQQHCVLKEQLATAGSMLKDATDRLAQKEQENLELATQLSLALEQTESLKVELSAAANDMNALESSHAKVVAERTRMAEVETMLEASRKEIEQFKEERDMNEHRVRMLSDEHKLLQEHLTAANEAKESTEVRLLDIETEKSQLQVRLSEKEEMLLSLKDELASILKEKDDAVALHSVAQDGHKTSTAKTLEMARKTQLELDKVCAEKKQLEEKIESLQLDQSATEVKLVAATTSLQSKNKQISELEKEKGQLESQLCEAQEQVRRLQEENNGLKDEIEAGKLAKRELTSLKQNLMELEADRENVVKTGAVAANALEAEKHTLSTQLDQAYADVAVLQNELHRAKLDLEETLTIKREGMSVVTLEAEEVNDLNALTPSRFETSKVDLDRQVEVLTAENEKQGKKIRKLAKLLQRTLQEMAKGRASHQGGDRSVAKGGLASDRSGTDRVSGMNMEVKLQYRDKTTKEQRVKEVHADYTGPLVDSKPHGAGMLKFKCGDLYVGMFKNGELPQSMNEILNSLLTFAAYMPT